MFLRKIPPKIIELFFDSPFLFQQLHQLSFENALVKSEEKFVSDESSQKIVEVEF